jgi:hypothetical protein
MSISSAVTHLLIEPTATLRDLAQSAGIKCHYEAAEAKKTMPVSKLTYTPRYEEVTTEYYKSYYQVSRNII